MQVVPLLEPGEGGARRSLTGRRGPMSGSLVDDPIQEQEGWGSERKILAGAEGLFVGME